jgi:Na+/serine symporter
MKRLMIKSPFGWSKIPVFVSGMILGAVVALSSPGFSAGEDVMRKIVTSTLYAIAELAVDVEINASRIEKLGERVENLEAMLEEMSGKKN